MGGGHLGSIAALPGIRGAAETRAHSYAGYADQASKLPNTATNLLKQITIKLRTINLRIVYAETRIINCVLGIARYYSYYVPDIAYLQIMVLAN